MTDTIMDTGYIAEIDGITDPEQASDLSDLVATENPANTPMEFHVSMHGHTFRDMEELIVQAAARQLVGRYGGTAALQKQIETETIAQITRRADAVLSSVSADIIDQPMIPKFPGVKEEPVTMRDFIGLTGRAYLTEYVDTNGNPTKSNYHSKPRITHLVEQAMSVKFKREIEAATNAAISEIQKAIKAHHDAFLAAEKKRLSEALANLTGGASRL